MKTKNLFVISPHHYCHSTASLIEGLNNLDGIKVFSNTSHNYCKNTLQNLKTQVQVAKMADYVMLCHSALEPKYKQIIGPLVSELQDDIDVFLDGSDYYTYQDDPSKYKLYIKRELNGSILEINGNPVGENVQPLIFAAENRYFTKPNSSHRNIWRNKVDDLVCIMSACEKRPWRYNIMESLVKEFKNNASVFVGEYRGGNALTTVDTGDRHFSGYFKKLLDTRISVDAYGCGEARQTGRFWESLANGCMVMYQPIEPYVWNNTFVDGEDVIIYNSNEELIDKAKYYIINSEKAMKIASNGFAKLLRYHRTEYRAEEFLSLVGRYL
tara:strand:- start:591 stop:1568 length:978 start_codon:yes stop_codon:yes gene_type:complete